MLMEVSTAMSKQQLHGGGDAAKAMMVALGELSSARQGLEGEAMAPGTGATLQLTDKRPPRLRDAVLLEIMSPTPRVPFAWDSHKFLKNVRSAKRGAAAGPSGMTVLHLRTLFDSVKDQQLLCKLAQEVAVVGVTPTVTKAIRMGRMIAEGERRGPRHRCRDVLRRIRSFNSSRQRVRGPPHSRVVRVEPTFHLDHRWNGKKNRVSGETRTAKIVEETMGDLTQELAEQGHDVSTMKLLKVLDELEIGQSLAECMLMVLLPGESWFLAEMSLGP